MEFSSSMHQAKLCWKNAEDEEKKKNFGISRDFYLKSKLNWEYLLESNAINSMDENFDGVKRQIERCKEKIETIDKMDKNDRCSTPTEATSFNVFYVSFPDEPNRCIHDPRNTKIKSRDEDKSAKEMERFSAEKREKRQTEIPKETTAKQRNEVKHKTDESLSNNRSDKEQEDYMDLAKRLEERAFHEDKQCAFRVASYFYQEAAKLYVRASEQDLDQLVEARRGSHRCQVRSDFLYKIAEKNARKSSGCLIL